MSDGLDAARINQTLYIVEARLSEKLDANRNAINTSNDELSSVKDLSNQSLQQTILLYTAISELSLLVDELKPLLQELIDENKRGNGRK